MLLPLKKIIIKTIIIFPLKYCPVQYIAHPTLLAQCYSEISSKVFLQFLAWTREWLCQHRNIFPISKHNSCCYRVLLLETQSKHCTWRASKVVDVSFPAYQPTARIAQRAETVAGARGAHFHCRCCSACGEENEIQSPC